MINTYAPTGFHNLLANGKRSQVVIADDNFPLADSTTERNQAIVFEVQPKRLLNVLLTSGLI